MHTFQVKSTTESGLLVAITVIMALMAVYMPIAGIAAAMLWPLPIIVLIVRHGIKYGILSIVAASVIMSIVISPMSAVHMAATFGPTSLALGYGFYKKLSAARILFYGLIASLAGTFLTAGLAILITGVNPLAMAEQLESMKEAANSAFAMYGTMGLSADEIEQSKKEFMTSLEYVTLLLPVVFLLSGMLTAWLNFAVGGKILRRLGHQVSELPPFDEWRLPKFLLYIFAFALVGLYWGSTRQIELLQQISLNAYVFTTLAGFIQGASVLSALMRGHIRRWLFWAIVMIIFFNGLLSQILAVCGLFDILIDYRNRYFRK